MLLVKHLEGQRVKLRPFFWLDASFLQLSAPFRPRYPFNTPITLYQVPIVFIFKMHLQLALSLLVLTVCRNLQQQQPPTSPANTNSLLEIILTILALALIITLAWLNRVSLYECGRELREKIGEWVVKSRRKRSYGRELKEKPEYDENASARNSVFDHEKAYIQAMPVSVSHPSEEMHVEEVLPEEIQSDSPEANFQEVFKVKESKSKHKGKNKKSKSKLKGRLLGKGSDNQEEQETPQISNLIDQNQLSKDNSLSEDYKPLEEENVE